MDGLNVLDLNLRFLNFMRDYDGKDISFDDIGNILNSSKGMLEGFSPE